MADYDNEKINVLDDDRDEEARGQYTNMVSYVEDRFERAKDARYFDESRWLQSYRNYRGIYGPDVQFTETEKSRVFIKVTKTKVLAAYGQLIDVLFSQNRFPIGIDRTTLLKELLILLTLILKRSRIRRLFSNLKIVTGSLVTVGI